MKEHNLIPPILPCRCFSWSTTPATHTLSLSLSGFPIINPSLSLSVSGFQIIKPCHTSFNSFDLKPIIQDRSSASLKAFRPSAIEGLALTGTLNMIPSPPEAFIGGIVALGKFDALHIGHRELAIQASMVGPPFLLSFVGMAEVLGWEPRAPIVAKCDRKRVLSTWAPYCGNMAPAEFQIEFSSVRQLTPREFVEKLLKEFGVRGVVAGENYRFGYKAAGDARELAKLCKEYGMGAYIIKSVMDKNPYSISINSDSKDRGQVSSTRVRRALGVGDMKYVSQLLGRQHRVILLAKEQEEFAWSRHKLSVPKSCMLNLGPKEGLYGQCYVVIGDDDELVVPCSVVIDSTYIHIEMDEVGMYDRVCRRQDLRALSIEFGDWQC